MRAFPLSNWTELDIWQYIDEQKIEVVPLYFAKNRPIINRNETLIMVDDNRLTLLEDEKISEQEVRFRTLGCYPLTGAILSNATNVKEIISEMLESKFSERQGRLIDKDEVGGLV